jgi:hypothetical protein
VLIASRYPEKFDATTENLDTRWKKRGSAPPTEWEQDAALAAIKYLLGLDTVSYIMCHGVLFVLLSHASEGAH